MRFRVLCWVCLIACGISTRAAAGPLQDVEDSAQDRPERREREERQPESYRHHDPQNTTQGESERGPFATFLMYTFLAPWLLPYALLDDPCYARFAEHPYADDAGQLRPWLEREGCFAPGFVSGRRSAIQTEFEGGYVLQHIVAGSVGARVQLPRRIELLGRLTLWNDLDARPHEQALGGTLNLAARFAQSRLLDFRTGVGLRAFGLHQPLYGLDLMYGMDVYGEHPIMGHFELHAGTLGHAFSAQARVTLGVQLWKFEIYAGYDHTVFVRGHDRTRLGGPVFGVRAWF